MIGELSFLCQTMDILFFFLIDFFLIILSVGMARSYFKQEHDLGIYVLPFTPISNYLELLFCELNIIQIIIMSAEKRRAEAARIREKYPDRIPVRTCNCFFPLQ